MSNNGNKSGFEIRADLLTQAQGILECNLQRKTDAIREYNGYHEDAPKDLPLDTIDTVDVIKAARELYEFVNDKQ
jgi:hypothetical protein|tara:strand:+ start:682 stop:906 length:225 start_codon:yes stop_codon:yes gene_type:complete